MDLLCVIMTEILIRECPMQELTELQQPLRWLLPGHRPRHVVIALVTLHSRAAPAVRRWRWRRVLSTRILVA